MAEEKNQDWLYRLMQDQQRSSELSAAGYMPDVPRHNEHLSPRNVQSSRVPAGTDTEQFGEFAKEIADAIGVLSVGATEPIASQPAIEAATFTVPVTRDVAVPVIEPRQPQPQPQIVPQASVPQQQAVRQEVLQQQPATTPQASPRPVQENPEQIVRVDVQQPDMKAPVQVGQETPREPATLAPERVATSPPQQIPLGDINVVLPKPDVSPGIPVQQDRSQAEPTRIDSAVVGKHPEPVRSAATAPLQEVRGPEDHREPPVADKPQREVQTPVGAIRPAFLDEKSLPPSSPINQSKPRSFGPVDLPLANPVKREPEDTKRLPTGIPEPAPVPFKTTDVGSEGGWGRTADHIVEMSQATELYDRVSDYFEQQYQLMESMTLVTSMYSLRLRELSDRIEQLIPIDAVPSEYLS